MKTMISCLIFLALGVLVAGSRGSDVTQPVAPPNIISQRHYSNLTGPFPQTVLYTPTETGLYRVTGYMEMRKLNTSSRGAPWGLYIDWGGIVPQQTYLFSIVYFSDTPGSGSFTFRADQGYPISYNVTGPGDGEGGAYDLDIVLEYLSRY